MLNVELTKGDFLISLFKFTIHYSSMADNYLTTNDAGVCLAVKLLPRAAQNEIGPALGRRAEDQSHRAAGGGRGQPGAGAFSGGNARLPALGGANYSRPGFPAQDGGDCRNERGGGAGPAEGLKFGEKPAGGGGGGGAEFFEGTFLHFGGEAGNLADVSRLATLAPIGHGGEERAIGFQHELIQRRGGQAFPDVGGVFKRDNSRVTDQRTEREHLAQSFHAFRKAMEDAPQFSGEGLQLREGVGGRNRVDE